MGPHTEDTRRTTHKAAPMERPAFEAMNVVVLTGLLVTAMIMAIGYGSPVATVASALLLFVWYYFAPSMFMSSTNRRNYWEDEQVKNHKDPHNINMSRFHKPPRKFKRLIAEARSRDPDDAKKCCPSCGELSDTITVGKHVIKDPNRLVECCCGNPNCDSLRYEGHRSEWSYLPTEGQG